MHVDKHCQKHWQGTLVTSSAAWRFSISAISAWTNSSGMPMGFFVAEASSVHSSWKGNRNALGRVRAIWRLSGNPGLGS